jgi:hypothetical protein
LCAALWFAAAHRGGGRFWQRGSGWQVFVYVRAVAVLIVFTILPDPAQPGKRSSFNFSGVAIACGLRFWSGQSSALQISRLQRRQHRDSEANWADADDYV